MSISNYESDASYSFLDLLGGMNHEQFFSECWDRMPVVLQPSETPECLNNLSRQDVLQWYFEDATANTRLTTFSDDEPAMVDGRKRIESLLNGHDWTLDALGELSQREAFIARDLKGLPRFAPLMVACTKFWKTPCSLNLYLLHDGADRFPIHQDSHHIFALHTFGVKRWLFWPPTIELPMKRYKWMKEPEPKTAPLIFDVQAGEVLYLPTGWLHRTENVTEDTVHLSLGLRPLRWTEVMEKIVYSAAARYAGMRAYTPFSLSKDGIAYDLDYSHDLRLLFNLLGERADDLVPQALGELGKR